MVFIMRYLLRFISKFLDYVWFATTLYLILDYFDLDIFFILSAIISLPFLFIPIEAIQIKLFKTTIGKTLFGFKYKIVLFKSYSNNISIIQS